MFYKITRKPILLAFLIAFGFSSCELVSDIEEQTNVAAAADKDVYLIKAGAHNTTKNTLKKISATTMRFEVTFDSTAVYKTVSPDNQGDINKLYGLSDCNTEHHNNSARFGWRWFNNRLEIHAYSYRNKNRETKYIDYVELGKPYVYEIGIEDNKYIFRVNNKEVKLQRSCTGLAEGYLLYPYFGGDETAPHTIKIVVRDL